MLSRIVKDAGLLERRKLYYWVRWWSAKTR
jgi:hypothetical protein